MYNFLEDWIAKKRWGAIFILSRYLYRVGEEPLISDAMYDSLTNSIKTQYYDLFKDYLNRTYDEDPIPYNLLKEVGIEPVEFLSRADRAELYAQLDEEKSLSIDSVTSYADAFPFFQRCKGMQKNITMSLKMDGINTKTLYQDDKFGVAVSRARSGDGFDFTDTLANIIPLNINTGKKELKITGESFVLPEGLPVLRDKYNSGKYKTSKSSAISMLRVKHDLEDYKYLRTKIFSAEGLCDTLAETYTLLQEIGFDTVPFILVEYDEIPSTLEEFQQFLKTKFDYLRECQEKENIPADGVVCAIDDLLWNDTITNQYSDKQIACKFEYWKFDVYKARVTEIVTEQRRVNVSVKVKIETMTTSDDCEARVINSFNPAILIQNDIKVGTEIYFERNSGAVNILIHGKKLEDILKE